MHRVELIVNEYEIKTLEALIYLSEEDLLEIKGVGLQ